MNSFVFTFESGDRLVGRGRNVDDAFRNLSQQVVHCDRIEARQAPVGRVTALLARRHSLKAAVLCLALVMVAGTRMLGN